MKPLQQDHRQGGSETKREFRGAGKIRQLAVNDQRRRSRDVAPHDGRGDVADRDADAQEPGSELDEADPEGERHGDRDRVRTLGCGNSGHGTSHQQGERIGRSGHHVPGGSQEAGGDRRHAGRIEAHRRWQAGDQRVRNALGDRQGRDGSRRPEIRPKGSQVVSTRRRHEPAAWQRSRGKANAPASSRPGALAWTPAGRHHAARCENFP